MIRFGEENSPQDMTESPQQSLNNSPAWQTCAAIDDPARAIPAIEFRHVKFSYGDRWILDDVSFKVMRGKPCSCLPPPAAANQPSSNS